MRELLDIHEDLRVESVGPIDLRLPTERYSLTEALPFDQLPGRIAGFDIAIAPLVDKIGNDTRSDIKLKEYAIAGVPWLASPLGPYREHGEEHGGRLVADDDWFDALDELICDGKLRKKLAKKRHEVGARTDARAQHRRSGRTRCWRRSSWRRSGRPPWRAGSAGAWASASGVARLRRNTPCRRPTPPRPSGRSAGHWGDDGAAGPWLAVLADVGAAAGGEDLSYWSAAVGAGVAGAAVDEEAVLEGAAGAVEVAEVVDRRAVGVDPRLSATRIVSRSVSHCLSVSLLREVVADDDRGVLRHVRLRSLVYALVPEFGTDHNSGNSAVDCPTNMVVP